MTVLGTGHPHAVLFDCDGVLVDSETLSAEVLSDVLREHDVVLTPRQALDLLRGRRVAVWIAELMHAHAGLASRSDAATFETGFRDRVTAAYAHRLRPEPYAEDLLEALRLPYAIVSNAPRWKVQAGLSRAGLDRFAPVPIISAYELGAWKPSPDVYLAGADAVGYPPAHCVAVEDSAVGIEAAVAAGVPVLHYAPDARIPTHPQALARSSSHHQTLQFLHDLTSKESCYVCSHVPADA